MLRPPSPTAWTARLLDLLSTTVPLFATSARPVLSAPPLRVNPPLPVLTRVLLENPLLIVVGPEPVMVVVAPLVTAPVIASRLDELLVHVCEVDVEIGALSVMAPALVASDTPPAPSVRELVPPPD